MAGIRGFEPLNAEIKTRCLTAWRYPNRYFKSSFSDGLSASAEILHLKYRGALQLSDIPIVILRVHSLMGYRHSAEILHLKYRGALQLGDIPIVILRVCFSGNSSIKKNGAERET